MCEAGIVVAVALAAHAADQLVCRHPESVRNDQ